MATELSRKVHNLMAREMGSMGKFIIGKQCRDLGLNPDDISKGNLEKLSKAIGKVMVSFGGKEKALKIADEIRKLK